MLLIFTLGFCVGFAFYKCSLSVVGECEIIDGGTVDDDDLFWERKRVNNRESD